MKSAVVRRWIEVVPCVLACDVAPASSAWLCLCAPMCVCAGSSDHEMLRKAKALKKAEAELAARKAEIEAKKHAVKELDVHAVQKDQEYQEVGVCVWVFGPITPPPPTRRVCVCVLLQMPSALTHPANSSQCTGLAHTRRLRTMRGGRRSAWRASKQHCGHTWTCRLPTITKTRRGMSLGRITTTRTMRCGSPHPVCVRVSLGGFSPLALVPLADVQEGKLRSRDPVLGEGATAAQHGRGGGVEDH